MYTVYTGTRTGNCGTGTVRIETFNCDIDTTAYDTPTGTNCIHIGTYDTSTCTFGTGIGTDRTDTDTNDTN